MSKLKEIEKEILEIEEELAHQKTYLKPGHESQDLKDRLKILEKERQFIIDIKEPLWEKILWNIVTPIIVAVVITIITNKWLI
ncbi:MAG: hypothetical protein PHO86_04890 [Bacilli bacterium]|nr:hypothetical protein [Bacilli bacterium]